MRFWKIAPLIALSLLLTGCWEEQRQAMASCSAKIPFASQPMAKPPEALCMEAAGYVEDFNNHSCRVEAVQRRSPYCYRPKGFFPALGYRIEMLGDSGPKPPVTDVDHPQMPN